MRNKRMFSLDVVDTDNFLDMPASAQALYFHLGMRADDDGFISSPRKITNMVNCGVDDFKLLIAKGYLIPFESGVVVITHWKQNNYIRNDRYVETKHVRENSILKCENGEYSRILEEIKQGIPNDNQDVTECHTQNRIEENSMNNICSPEPDERESDFEKIYAIYPKKRGRTKAFSNYCSWLKGKVVNGKRIKLGNREMYLAVDKYVKQQQAAGVELEYYKNFDTLMGAQLLDYVEVES